jgi:S-disulfanyl-L-cysteine oxidoreductase SoxD
MTRKLMMASLIVVQGWILASAQSATAPDAVYSEAQSKRGETVYTKDCASCHGADMAGDGQTPSLTGKDFNLQWSGMPLSDLFDRIHATMPADNPGRLTPAEVADVIAFILNKAGLPAGSTELPADVTALKQMKYAAPKQ